jgi:hypothetical protein
MNCDDFVDKIRIGFMKRGGIGLKDFTQSLADVLEEIGVLDNPRKTDAVRKTKNPPGK